MATETRGGKRTHDYFESEPCEFTQAESGM